MKWYDFLIENERLPEADFYSINHYGYGHGYVVEVPFAVALSLKPSKRI